METERRKRKKYKKAPFHWKPSSKSVSFNNPAEEYPQLRYAAFPGTELVHPTPVELTAAFAYTRVTVRVPSSRSQGLPFFIRLLPLAGGDG